MDKASGELMKDSQPLGLTPFAIVTRCVSPLRPPGASRDISGWYQATFCASLACIIGYTAFGYVFVRAHAARISSEMALLSSYGMTALIRPDDVHLTGVIHLLASALFFGMTLGTLNAIVCMVFTFPAWIAGRFTRFDILGFAGAVVVCTYFTFSMEMPLVSIVSGAFCPVLFTAVWISVMRGRRPKDMSLKRWGAFCMVILAPLAVLVVTSPSFQSIRDSMLTLRITEPLSDIYYEHTLLPADVIKPASARSQNAIALANDIRDIGTIPHGTLWVRTNDPCALSGATLVVSMKETGCRSMILPDDGRSANEGNRIINEYAKSVDPNRYMRRGIGFFFFSGPLILIAALILSWFALALELIFIRNRAVSIIGIVLYVFLFAPVFHSSFLLARLKSHPEIIQAYAASPLESERYTAVATYPGALSKEDIVRFMKDQSSRIRLNAVIEAGQRRDASLLKDIRSRLDDTKMNVRTKACWALGRIQSDEVAPILDAVARQDPSWYVRNYAYASLGAFRPETRIVNAR